MITYNSINIGDVIYMVETSSVLEFIILSKISNDGIKKLKVRGTDLSFELEFNDVKSNSYTTKEEASANLVKHILNAVNVLVRDLSDNNIMDYIDLDSQLNKYRDLFPEMFI